MSFSAVEELCPSITGINFFSISSICGEYWWLALVNEVNREEKGVHCKFMHPHGYTENFYWSTRDDENYVSFIKILLKVNTPNTLSQSG